MSASPLIGDEGAAGWNASILQAAAPAPAATPAEGAGLPWPQDIVSADGLYASARTIDRLKKEIISLLHYTMLI